MSDDAIQPDTFAVGEPVIFSDRRGRTHLKILKPGERVHGAVGYLESDAIIGSPVGSRQRTSKGEVVALYRPTLEEYQLLMTRGAAIIPPKDVATIISWADIFPGATVVEAGVGSGSMTLGLLRAVGDNGRVIGFELRQEFLNRGRKNVEAWPEPLMPRMDLRLGDVTVELGELRGVDRVVLDLPEPWTVLPAAADALVPGGILLSYLPTIRQVDQLCMAAIDHREFAHPDVIEVLVRPWLVDRERMRPDQRMVSHTGFLVRMRRLGAMLQPSEAEESPTSSPSSTVA